MNSPPASESRGPQIYVHVEFGVSWTRRPAKKHEMTYVSRGLRERNTGFPRQVPAPNTNYLAAIHDFEQHQSRTGQLRRAQTDNDPQSHHQMQEYYQVGHHDYLPPQEQQPRHPRGGSRHPHERGQSAPPPIGENPWDVNVSQDPAGGAEPSADSRPQPDPWKALPAEPSQFRLGEGGMPWSA